MPNRQTADDQAGALRFAISAIVRRFSVSERADVNCCGMTVAQAATLGALRLEGAMRLGVLGRKLGIASSTLTRNLTRLEQRGYVERVQERADARAVQVRLTPRGRRAALDVERQELDFNRAILSHVPAAKREQLLVSLELMLGAVREATHECCPEAFDHLAERSRS